MWYKWITEIAEITEITRTSEYEIVEGEGTGEEESFVGARTGFSTLNRQL